MSDMTRRSVLIGAAVCPVAAQVAGCAQPGQGRMEPPPATGQVLAATADVPVGEAKIVDGTLITQPSSGVFKAFTARCTHAGCALAIKNNKIECPCHGSQFELDGEVARGPAMAPLVVRPVTVRGGEIVAG